MPVSPSVKLFLLSFFMLLMNAGCTSSKEKPIPATSIPEKKVFQDTIEPVMIDYNRLIGRWERPDGGYILEIRSASPNRKLDAGYFNPKPIHVGRAEWVVKDKKLFVLVELQDVNYPGSTYGLEYRTATDVLVGNYFQAVDESNYDVEFIREK